MIQTKSWEPGKHTFLIAQSFNEVIKYRSLAKDNKSESI